METGIVTPERAEQERENSKCLHYVYWVVTNMTPNES